jgi:ABC-type multidrug transport system fused ATPase/permease subunit
MVPARCFNTASPPAVVMTGENQMPEVGATHSVERMRRLPAPDPGTPDSRSATHYLRWLARVHARSLIGATALVGGWMCCQALAPAVLGRALDALVDADRRALAWWTGTLLALGLVQAVSGVLGHRIAVVTWLGPAYRTVQVVTRQVTRLGATLPKRITAGEVVAVGTSDIDNMGSGIEVIGRGTAALLAVVVVATIMLQASIPLGLVVVLGVPAVMVALTPLLRRLHHRQSAHRELVGELTGRANDIVTGLRVLRGIGGEQAFARRYRDESQRVRRAGVRVGRVQSTLDAAQMLLPGLFIVVVVWLGARFALAGAITPGQLVAFFACAVFLGHPLWHLTDATHKLTRAHVSARRVVRILNLQPEITDPEHPTTSGGELVDHTCGLVVAPGRVTALAAADPAQAAALARRLARYEEGEVSWGGVPLRDLPVAEVRHRILFADNGARLFGGRLRDELDVRGGADSGRLAAALHTASAADVVEALDAGLDTEIADGGREFSGGQRQRLLLVRALLADPEVLILVEPTSAVDAHTEAAIAGRLARARAGRTTVVVTTSPLLLDRVDTVAFLDGHTTVTGSHRELLRREPRYAATVTRGEDT